MIYLAGREGEFGPGKVSSRRLASSSLRLSQSGMIFFKRSIRVVGVCSLREGMRLRGVLRSGWRIHW
jgi:hypothetical protein